MRSRNGSGLDSRKLWYDIHESQCLADPHDGARRVKLIRTGCRAWHHTRGGVFGAHVPGGSLGCEDVISENADGYCECEDGRPAAIRLTWGRTWAHLLHNDNVILREDGTAFPTCREACTARPEREVADIERAHCMYFQPTHQPFRYGRRRVEEAVHCDEPLFLSGITSGHCVCEGFFAGFQASSEGWSSTRFPGTCSEACAMWARPATMITQCTSLFPGAGECSDIDWESLQDNLKMYAQQLPGLSPLLQQWSYRSREQKGIQRENAHPVAQPALQPDEKQLATFVTAFVDATNSGTQLGGVVRREGYNSPVRYSKDEIAMAARGLKEYRDRVSALTSPNFGREGGRGIVTSIGNFSHLLSLLASVYVLRAHGCTLPIEAFAMHSEMPPGPLVGDLLYLDVRVVDLDETLRHGAHPSSFAIKPWAIVASSFEEVLWMDSDNVPLRDPSFLFDEPAYLDTGLLLWPDFWVPDRHPDALAIAGIDPDTVAGKALQQVTFETGQIVLDKRRHWSTLAATLWLCRPPLYPLMSGYMGMGDKEAFAIAAVSSGAAYTMAPRRLASMGFLTDSLFLEHSGMLQFGPDNMPLFMHDNFAKLRGDFPTDLRYLRSRWHVFRENSSPVLVAKDIPAREVTRVACAKTSA